MNMNNPLIAFIVETIKRFGQKSPKFFKIWQVILSGLIAVMGLPELLADIKALHIVLPAWLEAIGNAKLAYTFLGLLIMSFQTTQSKPVITEEGNVVKETNAQALPFTAKHEEKLAVKNAVQNDANNAV